MTDSFERNLDTQARRLADIDKAIDAALADDPETSQLPVSADRQTYAQLTQFNDGLREQNGWSDVDLDAALTPEHRDDLTAWRQRQRLPWSTTDLAMVGVAGLVGALCVWFDSSTDRAVRTQFDALSKSDRVRKWEKSGKRLPIDFMGKGFGGRAHRMKSGGHDILRLVSTLRQIVDGEFRGVRWEFGERIPVVEVGQFADVDDWMDAAIALMQHLVADFLTPMSLPVPGMSWLYESDNENIKDFALHAYSGLRQGEGWNLRQATVGPGLTSVITELIIRTHVHADAYQRTGTAVLSDHDQRKHTELRLAAHSLVGAASLGKAAAAALSIRSERGVLHPAALRHIQVPALILSGKLAVTIVTDARAAQRLSAPSWDDLLIGTAQVWQLDLPASLERAALNNVSKES
ncbi:hypothetical protein [Antrihabitans spumae]|uniref:Uncharacterized protein n=1 Tax=Antrihabitans spumae TaxID=3373370 RepID=A0ABW7K972_9NOCA